ncbi:NUDIX hydrolase [Aeromicrobium sp. CF3.5]|uniref:NUDIX hydrolase n=1 Tax=Aeromicrobium sp. CF3.5 TaxID=3373078 RepID=UPI003EE7DE79
MMPVIRVVAALVTDPEGRVLLVRKRDTVMFMNPGGKPESEESPEQALCRELAEEIGLEVSVSQLRPMGSFTSAAANEPGHEVRAEVFALQVDHPDHTIGAEIVESVWVDPTGRTGDIAVAPLATEHLLPLAVGQRP